MALHLTPQLTTHRGPRLVGPGDVLVVYDSTWPAWFIRLGQWLMFKPRKWNHVVIVTHQDAKGVWWGVEAHPGRVGLTSGPDMLRYMTSPKTIDNARQPKTEEQRNQVVAVARDMMHGPQYDWSAIVENAFLALRIDILWYTPDLDTGKIPTHVICSSLATWVYRHVGLESPPYNRMRDVCPGDWAAFIIKNKYDSVTGEG